MSGVFERCRRHGALLGVFFEERARIIQRVSRLRRRDELFTQLFKDAEERVVARGVPPMFTLRPALRDLDTRAEGQPFIGEAVAVAERANRHMRSMVEEEPWPLRDEVGWAGLFAAAALIAHADDDTALRRIAIDRMRVAVESNGVDARHFAHVVDRAHAMEGRPQTYGTLFLPVDGEPQFCWPVAGEDEVADARRTIGLPSINEDRQRYERGARPGPFLVPYARADWIRLYVRITLSGLRHGRPAA